MITELRRVIQTHLSILDDRNESSMGEVDATKTDIFHQLMGMSIILSCLGLTLELDINPSYYRNKIPSTYCLREATPDY